jgi:CheY-like chemotaxis protein
MMPGPAVVKPRVLVVDDDADTVESTALLFRMEGFDIDTALDGHAAVARAKAHCPDLVLLDIGMPHMDGYEVAEALRDLPCLPLLVAVSGYARAADKRRCAEIGFDLHVAKPVDFAVLQHLRLVLATTARLTEQSRALTRDQTAAFIKFIDLEIEMAGTFLDVAVTTRNADTKQRCLDKARKTYQNVNDWLAKMQHQRPEVSGAVELLRQRYERLRREL